jgi:pyruvate/2-oxoacid:ferredoxin oxidoreductase alpha subunit
MGTINAPNPSIDTTVKIFDTFYAYEQNVSAEEYDVVYSFFRSVFTSAEAAGNFTVALFRVANQSRVPVLNLLQQMEGQNQVEITITLAYYLNGIRSPATLLGIAQPTAVNYYASRNVLL